MVSSGTRLGEVPQLASPFKEGSMQFGEGDIFFLYTDGLPEGKNPEGEMYGKKKVRQSVERQLAAGPETLVSQVVIEFLAHNQDKALDDDVTVVAMRLAPGKNA